MSKQYPGGILSKTPVTPSGPYINSTASGIWTLEDQVYWQKLGQWPNPANPAPDAQFNYVTMLLHGDGTNGAQNNTFIDSSTNNFTITRNGNTTQGSFSPYGSYCGGYFDPATTGISIVVDDSLSTNPYRLACSGTNYTIEFWVFRLPRVATYQCMHSAAGDANNFVIDSSDNLGVTSNGGTTMFTVAANTYIPVNTWTYVTLVCENTTWSLYFNGTLYGTYSGASKTYGGGGSGGIQTGGRNDMNGCGYISNFRVSSVARYSGSAFTVPTAPLAADGNTALFLCSLNRFIDASQYNSTYTITFNSTPSIQRFNSFGAGSTAYSTSVIGGSGYFDGTGDYLTTTMTGGLGSGDFTVELWVYATSIYNYITWFATTRNSTGFSCGTDANGALVWVNGVGSVTRKWDGATTAGNVIRVNSWNHVAFVRSSNLMRVYLNGVATVTTTSASSVSDSANYSNTNLSIGSLVSGGGEFPTGYLCDGRITTSALYTTTFTPPTAPLTAVSGVRLLNNYTNGAIFDNAMMNDLETVGNAQISTSVKKYGTGSLYFDGTGDYLTAPSNPAYNLGSGNFTIEFWVYPNTISIPNPDNESWLVARTDYTANTGWSVFQANQQIRFRVGNTGGTIATGNIITATTWQHIAVVRSGSTVSIYVDGTSRASGTNSSFTDASTVLVVGGITSTTGWNGDKPLNGYIDDLRITKGYARYTTTFTPPTAAFPNTGPY